jgi:hypothetical protein
MKLSARSDEGGERTRGAGRAQLVRGGGVGGRGTPSSPCARRSFGGNFSDRGGKVTGLGPLQPFAFKERSREEAVLHKLAVRFPCPTNRAACCPAGPASRQATRTAEMAIGAVALGGQRYGFILLPRLMPVCGGQSESLGSRLRGWFKSCPPPTLKSAIASQQRRRSRRPAAGISRKSFFDVFYHLSLGLTSQESQAKPRELRLNFECRRIGTGDQGDQQQPVLRCSPATPRRLSTTWCLGVERADAAGCCAAAGWAGGGRGFR